MGLSIRQPNIPPNSYNSLVIVGLLLEVRKYCIYKNFFIQKKNIGTILYMIVLRPNSIVMNTNFR